MAVDKLLNVTLEEISHTYSDTYGKTYTPVSSILSKYKEPFDPYKITKDGLSLIANYVIKHGETEQYWLDKWGEANRKGCDRGSAWHKIREDIHNKLHKVERPKTFLVQDFNKIVDRNPGIDYSQLPIGSYRELTLFNRRYMIAGQADNVIIDEDGYFDIDDDKTNGNFETMSFKPPRGQHRMMYYPLQTLMDCHLYHYTMQLSTYAWMLEQFGLKARRLRLLHFMILPEDEKKILAGEMVNIEPTQYFVKYERELVEKMIRHYTTVHRRIK